MRKERFMRNLTAFEWVALIIVFIGGLNWGLIGLFDFNLVDVLFGAGSPLTRIVYVIVGLAAVYVLIDFLSRREITRSDR